MYHSEIFSQKGSRETSSTNPCSGNFLSQIPSTCFVNSTMEDLTFFAFGEDKKMQMFGDLSQLLTWEVKTKKTWQMLLLLWPWEMQWHITYTVPHSHISCKWQQQERQGDGINQCTSENQSTFNVEICQIYKLLLSAMVTYSSKSLGLITHHLILLLMLDYHGFIILNYINFK